MLGKCLLSVLAVFLFCGAGKDIYLKNITVAELQKIYRQENYKDYIYMPDWRYPRIFLENLPKDMAQMPTLAERNKIFLMILGPLALRLEAEIQKEREEILKLDDDFRQKKDLTPQQVKTLEEKAEKYEVFSGLKGQRRYRLLLDELLLRVDGVPPSILMAAAAINTDWGTSRPAREANNLYKDIEWHTDQGLKPEDSGEDYRFRIYPSLYDSMKAYAHRINAGTGYLAFRQERKEIKYRDKPVLGRHVASSLVLDSNLENFAGLLDYTIAFYELTNFDEASLK